MRAYADSILEMRCPELETALVELAEDTVFFALFTAPTKLLPEPRECDMRHRSSHTIELDEARSRKNK